MNNNTSITLHPTKGVNPFMTYCPRCGGESQELILLGIRDHYRDCGACGIKLIGFRAMEECPKCGHRGPHGIPHPIKDGERLPSHGPCDTCAKELKEWKAIVDSGGIYFKCDECNRNGVIKPSAPICKLVREKMKIEAPAPCGIQFSKCKEHSAE